MQSPIRRRARAAAVGLAVGAAVVFPGFGSGPGPGSGSGSGPGPGSGFGAGAAILGRTAFAESAFLDRGGETGVAPVSPADRVVGEPGRMRVVDGACPSLPLESSRQRIVDLAAQEWAYFGFSVTDRVREQDERSAVDRALASILRGDTWRRRARDFSRMRGPDFGRVTPSIAGYWAATPDGQTMLDRQNAIWSRTIGSGSRWRDPWSAAFISWVMCEAGIGQDARFQRSIAHREYIDQAIRARDGAAPGTAFVAHDLGEQAIVPGDLLCSGTRSGYRTIDDRRRQMGRGASTHCDAVVSVVESAGIIMAIGGNVRRSVSLKRLPAERARGAHLVPSGEFFAHLKLRAGTVSADALAESPTVERMACTPAFQLPSDVVALQLDLTCGSPISAASAADG